MMGALRRALALVGILLATGACRDVAGPEPVLSGHRSVYAVLEVASEGVALLAEVLTDVGSREPLRGAQVTVSGASGSVALTEAALGPPTCFLVETTGPGPVLGEEGCYTGALPEPAGALEALTLSMMLPDGSQVQGELVTPDRPVASIPPDSQRVTPYLGPRHPLDHSPRAIVPIILDAAPGAQRVDIVATVARAFPGGEAVTVDPSACEVDAWAGPYFGPRLQGTHDWYLYELPRCRAGVPGGDSVDLAIHVIAMEENYAGYMNHVLGSSSIDVSRGGFGLEGAVGVFGAVATTVLSLRLILVQ